MVIWGNTVEELFAEGDAESFYVRVGGHVGPLRCQGPLTINAVHFHMFAETFPVALTVKLNCTFFFFLILI